MAQQDPIAARKALMKANGDQAKIGAAMAKGEAPFDLGRGAEDFRDVRGCGGEDAGAVPGQLRRPAAIPRADPKIWENMADFKAKFVKFGEDAKAAGAKVTDLDSFKAALRQYRQERLRRLPSRPTASRRAERTSERTEGGASTRTARPLFFQR